MDFRGSVDMLGIGGFECAGKGVPRPPASFPSVFGMNPLPEPPFLSLYLHAPFCRRACPYCDFYKVELPERRAAGEAARRFLRLALRELDLLLAAHPGTSGRALGSVYFGGGTPSLLDPPRVGEFLRAAAARLPFASGAEITLEANPDSTTPARLAGWREAGVNRLSLGVQSFHGATLKRLGRLHGAAAARRALREARKAGFTNLSLDLIFGAPGQGMDEWLGDIEEAIAFAPEHISFYGLTIHEDTPFAALERAGALGLPGEDAQAGQYTRARHRLIRAGYEHYEISNFALPGRRARHNENYWLGGEWLALGPSAHASFGGLRWENPRDLAAWSAALEAGRLARSAPAALTREEIRIESLFLGLRRAEGLDLAALRRATGFDLARERASALERLAAAGWLHAPAPGRLALTARGFLVADSILRELA